MRVTNKIFAKVLVALLFAVTSLLLGNVKAYAQPKPPRPVKVTINAAQGIQFGAFVASPSQTGTLAISPFGVRSPGAGIILVNLTYSFAPAIYNITTTPGTLIALAYTQSTLSGPVPNTPLTLNMGPSEFGNSFVATQSSFTLRVGGTLSVPANPTVGAYSGIYTITFIQQ